jgi:branched-chain amino acid transport system permease protein
MYIYVVQQLINALAYGSVLGLLAVGYTMIYGILGLINFAHGEIFMAGAFACYLLVKALHLPFIIGAVGAVVASILIGLLLYKIVYQPCIKHKAPVLAVFIASFGASLGLKYLFMMFFGDQRRAFPIPEYLTGVHVVGQITVNTRDFVMLIATIIIMVVIAYLIRYTRVGIAMRAVSYNMKIAEVMGVDSIKIVVVAFIIGSALAGVSAVQYGLNFSILYPNMGFTPGLEGFIGAVLGGIGNVPGAMIGGFIIGIGEILFVALLPPSFSAVRPMFVWGLLFLILFLKPTGLFRPNVKYEGIWGE